MEGFLIGTGMALLLVLIGWSEQVKSWHKDTIEAEKEFSKSHNLKWKEIRPLIRTETLPVKKLKALNKLLIKKSLKEVQDVKIIEKLLTLDKERNQLENFYRIKYKLIFIMTILYFSSGIINYFIKDNHKIKICIVQIPAEFIPIFSCVLFSIGFLCFNSHLNKTESKYKNELIDLMEKL